MEDQLDKYFQKARESIGDAVPISEIKAKLSASSGSNGGGKWLPTRFQVIIGLVVTFAAVYLFIDSRVGEGESKEAGSDVTQQEEVVNFKDEIRDESVVESTIDIVEEEPAAALVDNENSDARTGQAESDIAAQANTSTSSEEPRKAEEGDVPKNKVSEPIAENNPPTEPPKVTKSRPKAVVEKPKTVTETQDVNAITHHQIEILSNYSESRLKKLDRELKRYGLTLKIDVLKYGKDDKISKFKGAFVSIETNRKTVFNVPAFNKLFLDFDYSISKGPDKMIVSGK